MEIGLFYASTVTVSPGNTALALGSGSLEVFATPAMTALMENAAMNAVAASLPEGSTTVGTKLDIAHTRATASGETVTAEARLVEVDGRRLVFEVEARDSMGTIGRGMHERFVVDREKFMAKLKK